MPHRRVHRPRQGVQRLDRSPRGRPRSEERDPSGHRPCELRGALASTMLARPRAHARTDPGLGSHLPERDDVELERRAHARSGPWRESCSATQSACFQGDRRNSLRTAALPLLTDSTTALPRCPAHPAGTHGCHARGSRVIVSAVLGRSLPLGVSRGPVPRVMSWRSSRVCAPFRWASRP